MAGRRTVGILAISRLMSPMNCSGYEDSNLQNHLTLQYADLRANASLQTATYIQFISPHPARKLKYQDPIHASSIIDTMLQTIAFTLALASLAKTQDTSVITSPINPKTVSPILPSVTVNSSALTSITATIDGQPTTIACVQESDLVFSIQTDTNLNNEPASTPVCGQSTTYALPGPITNSLGNLTMTTSSATLSGGSVSETTRTGTATGSGSSSAAAETQSGNPAAKNAVGGMAGVLGLGLGMVFL
ncbi:hypothetical protein AC578_1883 [Pseudocercospora eumusae]|uniref:Uncharacterized protein n=1 Tax=Pseudocercospora eumusae TaxID=321146 RepID=A0A139H3F4_9PEZI|nr:hypothetical protein AC578_1883 [Pseudocercospora eumusae]